MVNKLILLSFLLFIGCGIISKNEIIGQENNACYQSLSFMEFLSDKVENDTNFVNQIHAHVRYPDNLRKHEIQGIVEIILLNHDENNIEVILANHQSLFWDIVPQIESAIKNVMMDRTMPFLTRFFIDFNINAIKYKKENHDNFHLGIINNNTISFVTYVVPEIIFH